MTVLGTGPFQGPRGFAAAAKNKIVNPKKSACFFISNVRFLILSIIDARYIPHHLFEPATVLLVESIRLRAVHVEHAHYFLPGTQRNDDLRSRETAAGNVSGEGLYIGDDQGPGFGPAGPADALALTYTRTGHGSLKRSYDQLPVLHE